MILKDFRPLQRGEAPAPKTLGEIPDREERVQAPVHAQLRDLTRALQRRLSVGENHNSEVRDIEIASGETQDVGLKVLQGRPRHVLSTGQRTYYEQFLWSVVDLQTIRVTFQFSTLPTFQGSAPSGRQGVRLLILGD